MFGVDVSTHQGVINWRMVADNYEFALIKASEGATHDDPRFIYNMNEALAAGMEVGVYHYWRPGIDQSAQVEHFHRVVKGYLDDITRGVWLDMEDFTPHITDRTVVPDGEISAEISQALEIADTLFDRAVGVYTGAWFWDRFGLPPQERPLWVADWSKQPGQARIPNSWTTYDVHQYMVGGKGHVLGIKGEIDLNYIPDTMTLEEAFASIRRALDSIESTLK